MISFSIASGNSENRFAIDENDGELKLVQPLDRETTTSYSLVVHAVDQGTTPNTDSVTVTITVTDYNDNAPLCTPSIHGMTLPENSAAPTPLYALACTDADETGTDNSVLTYTMNSGNTLSAFALSATTGVITVQTQSALDAETTSSYTLVVEVADKGTIKLSSTVTVIVTMEDVNEHDPVFSLSGSYSESVAENAAPGTAVSTTVAATDADLGVNGMLKYSITNGNTGNAFNIDPDTAVVYLQGTLDIETLDTYTLEITATDQPTVPANAKTQTANLVITLSDINDVIPACPSAPYVKTYPESQAINSVLETVVCPDTDKTSANNVLTYNLVTVNALFSVEASTGKLILAQQMNFEVATQHELWITATDSGSSPLTGTATVIIIVTPINDYPPVITDPSAPVSIPEDHALGSPAILTLVASDSDAVGTVHREVKFSITGGNIGNVFAVEELTGKLTVVAPLDRETITSYSLSVTATDSLPANGDERTDVTTVTVNIDDVNDNTPVFNPATYGVSVLEGATVGFSVTSLTVTDLDAGVNGQIDLVITGGNTGTAFTLDGSDIDVAAALNYETTKQYILVVEARDRGVPTKLSSSTTVVISVQGENEHTPTLPGGPHTKSLPEDSAVGTSAYDITATDNDDGVGGELVYFITAGNPNDAVFVIDTSSGLISTAAFLDYDTSPSVYELEVTVKDDGGLGTEVLSASVTVTVSLTDINDNPPVFTEASYTASVAENIGSSQSVTTVAATDADSGVNDDVTYTITSGSGTAQFTIHSTSGVVSTSSTQTLDYELTSTYQLVVKATDGGIPSLTAYCVVQITITDVNDNTPIFHPANFYVNLNENEAASYSVATLYATDADDGVNDDMDFSMVASTNVNGHFALSNAAANNVDIVTQIALDRETIGQ